MLEWSSTTTIIHPDSGVASLHLISSSRCIFYSPLISKLKLLRRCSSALSGFHFLAKKYKWLSAIYALCCPLPLSQMGPHSREDLKCGIIFLLTSSRALKQSPTNHSIFPFSFPHPAKCGATSFISHLPNGGMRFSNQSEGPPRSSWELLQALPANYFSTWKSQP